MRTRHLTAAAVVLLTAGGVVALRGPAAAAAPACTVVYQANQWSTGFTADVQVTNGGAAVTSWALSWTYAGNQLVTGAWNATVTQKGSAVTAANAAWNGSLATGATADFGFQATQTASHATPTDFTFNGTACNGNTTTTGPTTTTPTTGPTTTPPTTTPPTTTPPTTTPPTTTPPTTTPPTTTPPTTTPPTTTPTPGGDGFENQTGTTPTGNWSISYPDCQGSGTATIDHTVAHTGTTSLRVDGAAGYCNHVFVRDTALLAGTTDTWYVRYYVRHTTALPAQHVTAVAMTDANDGGKDLRFGGQNGAMQFNRASDDATLPEQSPAGVALSAPLPVGTWNCVQFKISGADGTIGTWLNGAAVPGLTEDGVPTHDIDSQWLNRTWRPKLTDLRLGWESYGEGADTLWYDDVAVSPSQIAC